MRRLLAIVFLQIYFLAFVEGHEFLRVPLLIQHYITHKHENPQMSLLDFFSLHYSGKIIYDADWQQDMQLPFKSVPANDLCLYALSSIVTPLQYSRNIQLSPPEPHSSLHLPQNNQDLCPVNIISEILKPPRYQVFFFHPFI
ncbi:hypothetical protein [Thermoflavifilum thermophilum]|uniref:Uncharacterized protein n=1 Tax=Thermoflavifilum thermophilum TaxID=1393122 RepID=A0A1I7N9C2_9BACT|nr:hypothetical protein [Thermoflavifilum thermophilum]SFV31270.1 hypothetical protein SAMN05660895_1027 [Thermoflavifilum thermophilum]